MPNLKSVLEVDVKNAAKASFAVLGPIATKTPTNVFVIMPSLEILIYSVCHVSNSQD